MKQMKTQTNSSSDIDDDEENKEEDLCYMCEEYMCDEEEKILI